MQAWKGSGVGQSKLHSVQMKTPLAGFHPQNLVIKTPGAPALKSEQVPPDDVFSLSSPIQSQPAVLTLPVSTPKTVVSAPVETPAITTPTGNAPLFLAGNPDGEWLLAGTSSRATKAPGAAASPMGATVSLEESLAVNLAKLVQPTLQTKKQSNHPGVELHNHLLGIVDANYFIQKTGEGSPRRLLTRIDTLFRQDSSLQADAPELWKLLDQKVGGKKSNFDLTMQEVRWLLEKLLTATPQTPFDSVYTPRDELISRHLELPPQEMSGVLTRFAETHLGVGQDLQFKKQMVQAFGGDQGHKEEVALQAVGNANLDELISRGGLTAPQAIQFKSMLVNARYEAFAEDTVRVLSKDNIHYSEQSVSVNKLNKQLTPQVMDRVAARVAADGIKSDVRFLAMVNTSHMSDQFIQQINHYTGMPFVFEQPGLDIDRKQYDKLLGSFQKDGMSEAQALASMANSPAEELEKHGLTPEQARIIATGLPPRLKVDLQKILSRGDVMGIDIAAPEKENFTQRGMANFDEMYEIVKSAAKERGRALALRPHVGEGYPEMPEGMDKFRRYGAKREQETGKPTHYDTAINNLETLIGHLEERGYSAQKAAEDGVIIRFGHATHATPRQIDRMKSLGVVAEANLSSNVETGALQPVQGGDFFENHSLLNLLYKEVPTVLNTDAHGVMHTTLTREYQQADRLISLFKRGKMPMQLEDRQVYFKDLSETEQARFDCDHLRKWAAEYGDFVDKGDLKDKARRSA